MRIIAYVHIKKGNQNINLVKHDNINIHVILPKYCKQIPISWKLDLPDSATVVVKQTLKYIMCKSNDKKAVTTHQRGSLT